MTALRAIYRDTFSEATWNLIELSMDVAVKCALTDQAKEDNERMRELVR